MGKKKITTKTKPIISMQKICKAFPLVQANDHIDLDIYPYEIQALLGENGAGKSTLMKILYGFYRADSGTILFKGEPVQINSPLDALDIHIGMVFQNLNIIPAFTVAENIALFLKDLKIVIHMQSIHTQIEEISSRYGLDVDPKALASQLSIGQLQKVEIVKLLMSEANILILDEPTRVLAPHEVENLFDILKNLCADGFAVVLIAHKLKEVMDCADRITVLRNGKVVGTLLSTDADEGKLIELMFERKLSEIRKKKLKPIISEEKPVLYLENVSSMSKGASTSLKSITLKVSPGEIVGVAGVSGNGQRELGDVILGISRSSEGIKQIFGMDTTNQAVDKIRDQGIGFIPEDPLKMAAIPFMTIKENMVITMSTRFQKMGGLFMNWENAEEFSKNALSHYDCTFSINSLARTLSGGNLQRMIVARELSHHPGLVIASYLTRGLDARSTIAARKALLEVRNQGAGVLLISEDLDELFQLSDRLIVLYDGSIVGEFIPEETNPFAIGHLMTGLELENV
jgi:ABC-type uncharacterized transport system ATPase subunit